MTTAAVRVAAGLVVLTLALFAGKGARQLVDDLGDSDDHTLVDTVASAPTVTSTPPPPSTPAPAPVVCPPEDGSGPRVIRFDALPPTCIDTTERYRATIKTTLGDMAFELDARRAPLTVNNFVFLARNHFYDGRSFHRIIEDFVAQAGDAGQGAPGYTIVDELPAQGEYRVGSLAMANAGPNTNSSQFFIVTGAAGVALPPQYSLFGSLSTGFDVLDAIDKLGDQSGIPDATVGITTVEISVSD